MAAALNRYDSVYVRKTPQEIAFAKCQETPDEVTPASYPVAKSPD